MDALRRLVTEGEEWLMARVLRHASERGYTRYTSTLLEAWRLSIRGLSQSLLSVIEEGLDLELGPDEAFRDDPAARFGLREARLHRERGVSLGMFLGLMKYYRLSYAELLAECGPVPAAERYLRLVERFFDRVEIAFCSEWVEWDAEAKLAELQVKSLLLTNEKNKYVTVIESVPIPVLLVSPSGGITHRNRAATELLGGAGGPGEGYYREDPGGCPPALAELLPWLEADVLSFAAGREGTREFETGVATPDGGRIFRVRLSRMLDVSAKFEGTVVLLEDVTERYASERAVAEAELRFRTLFEQSPDGVVIIDPRSRLPLAFNEAAHRNMGYSREEFAALRIEDYEAREDPTATRARVESILRQGRADFETVHRGRAGEQRNVLVSVQALELSGRPCFYCIYRDVTELRRAREAVELKARLLDAVTDSVFLVDPAGRVVYANEGACRALGYPRGELLDLSVEQIDSAEHAPRASERIELIQAHGELAFETVHRRRDGTLLPVEVHARLVSVGAENLVLAVARDVTLHLETGRRMREAKELAEAASRAKSEFLANMSHEIRTPLNAVMGLAHLLGESDLDDRQRDYVAKLSNSAESLLGVLNDILDFSKVEAGRLELEHVPFNLADVLESLRTIASVTARGKDLEVLFSVDPAVPFQLVGDALRLRQVLVNLLGNALKFTERGEIEISIAPAAVEEERTVLRFAVRDTGTGMAPERLPELFRPFSQLDSSTTRRYGGTGLGLAICGRLVGLMGGEIEVTSDLGRGSTFSFTAAFGRGSSPEAAAAERRWLAELSVLVVDDDPAGRQSLAVSARSCGWIAREAASGEEAVAEVRRASVRGRPYDLVLMDWRMPGMDGLEAARQIRALVDCPPVVLTVTSSDTTPGPQEIRRAGIAGVLAKPVTASHLVDAVVGLRSRSCAEPAGPVRPRRATGRRPLEGVRLLLVEDNAVNRQVALEILEGAGATVETAEDGEIALRLLEGGACRPEAVLMDVHMPRMDGYEATRALRALPGGADLPIIAMTANALIGDREHCLAEGMNDHVAKPLDVPSLLATVARWVRRPFGETEAAGAATSDEPLPEGLEGPGGLQALDRLDGDRELLCELLALLVEDHAGDAGRIREALDAGNAAAAKHLAHALKGAAANLGCTAVRDAAAELEAVMRAGEMPPPPLLEALETALSSLAATVPNGANAPPRPPPADPGGLEPSPKGLEPLLWRLGDLATRLEAQDLGALDVAARLRAELEGAGLGECFDGVWAAIDRLDFRAALVLLEAHTARPCPAGPEAHAAGGGVGGST